MGSFACLESRRFCGDGSIGTREIALEDRGGADCVIGNIRTILLGREKQVIKVAGSRILAG